MLNGVKARKLTRRIQDKPADVQAGNGRRGLELLRKRHDYFRLFECITRLFSFVEVDSKVDSLWMHLTVDTHLSEKRANTCDATS